MSGPKNALASWGSSALRPVELPTGTRALIKLPDVRELILHDALPEDLRELAFRYAQGGIEISKLEGDDVKRFLSFTYELVSRMLKYLAPADSEAWDEFRRTGGSPTIEGWEPVTLSPGELRELDVDQADIDALALIASRNVTPNEITARSRFDRGLMNDVQRMAAEAGQEPGQKTGDFVTFREEPEGDRTRDHGADVVDPPVGASAGGRPGSRVRGRRSRRA